MILVDQDEAVKFSDAFHQEIFKCGYVDIAIFANTYGIIANSVPEVDKLEALNQCYCMFRCWRDLQTFLAVRGWCYKNYRFFAEEGEPNYVHPNKQLT